MISVVQLGTVDYATTLWLQQSLVEMRKTRRIGDTLLLLEHSPVITLGRNAKKENVLAEPARLAERGVELFECDRGGDVTFHGPGQLVGYPVFDLRGFAPRLGAVEYVRRLEEVLIRTCGNYHISAGRVAGLTGVWTHAAAAAPAAGQGQPAKIAAIGVHISRSVTSHGFALNVNTDLSYFDLIVPCGITSRPVTSMEKELGAPQSLGQVAQAVAGNCGDVFAREMVWVETLDALLGRTVGVPLKAPPELRHLQGEDETFWV